MLEELEDVVARKTVLLSFRCYEKCLCQRVRWFMLLVRKQMEQNVCNFEAVSFLGVTTEIRSITLSNTAFITMELKSKYKEVCWECGVFDFVLDKHLEDKFYETKFLENLENVEKMR